MAYHVTVNTIWSKISFPEQIFCDVHTRKISDRHMALLAVWVCSRRGDLARIVDSDLPAGYGDSCDEVISGLPKMVPTNSAYSCICAISVPDHAIAQSSSTVIMKMTSLRCCVGSCFELSDRYKEEVYAITPSQNPRVYKPCLFFTGFGCSA